MDDRWKCPDCGRIVVDPISALAGCACGSERIQLREWPNAPGDWEPPAWPDDSDYSPDPHDVETVVRYKKSISADPTTERVAEESR